VHALAEHTGWARARLVVHVFPHVPQLWTSLVLSTQLAPQSDGVDPEQPVTHE
jgi:hypothetical protein